MQTEKAKNDSEFELDGIPITIRPINLQDMPLERDFIDRLSPETKHYRFFGAIKNVSDKVLKSFCDIDGKDSMAFIATEEVNGKEIEIGVCRYAISDAPDIHEMALTIADKWQHKGLGKLLIKQLMSYAKSHGIKTLYSVELAENPHMHGLSKELGMLARRDPEDPHQVIYSLAL
ncbi:GNAT family N-acetyltransferase [uncultured Paraglaciecola sp.]|uniref:GNAT family N-acetyltransferase n=1 Tax=uncultured Paraglaciecola sp. TaxID=1765024 RepID=UPI0030DCFB0E|tara:strand:+ start:169821 stop:170345 length:525 start_codon:yes stop_codon:yes gene_type:complete